jgi:hypothetical protein
VILECVDVRLECRRVEPQCFGLDPRSRDVPNPDLLCCPDGISDPDATLVERQQRSKPVWDELVAWCTVHKKHEQPSSPLGVALRYFTNDQAALGRFLDYGYVPWTTAPSSGSMSAPP